MALNLSTARSEWWLWPLLAPINSIEGKPRHGKEGVKSGATPEKEASSFSSLPPIRCSTTATYGSKDLQGELLRGEDFDSLSR